AYASARTRLEEETAKLQDISFQIVDAITAASAPLANLGRHEAVLSRSLLQTLHELQRLQAARAGEYVPAPAVVDVNLAAAPSMDQADPQSRPSDRRLKMFFYKTNPIYPSFPYAFLGSPKI